MTKPGAPGETIVSSSRDARGAACAVITLTSGEETGRVVSIGEQPVTLGRAPECTVAFSDRSLSRVHAKIVRLDDQYLLHDLGSRNGSFVNEVAVDFATPLESGDRIRLGDTTLRFFVVGELEERQMRESFAASRRDVLLRRFQELSERDGTLREELVAAAEFQQRALAHPPHVPGVGIEVLYRPLDLVGGDLYHVAPLPGGARIFVADATGHGLRAALTMMLMLSEYESARSASSPRAILRELNERFAISHAHLGVRFTAVCLDVDLARGELRFATAAHPPCFVQQGGEIVELDTGGPFVGLLPEVDFPEHRFPLQQGARIVAYTDGLLDAWDRDGQAFGEARLLAALREAPRGGVALAVGRALDAHGAGRIPDDDVSLIAAELGEPT